MTRILAAALALLLAFPAAVSASDVNAFSIYHVEYKADRAGILELFRLYSAAPSATERRDSLLRLQNALSASLDRLEAADVRECFRHFHELVTEEFEAVAFSVTTDNPIAASLHLVLADGAARALRDEVRPTQIHCMEVA